MCFKNTQTVQEIHFYSKQSKYNLLLRPLINDLFEGLMDIWLSQSLLLLKALISQVLNLKEKFVFNEKLFPKFS